MDDLWEQRSIAMEDTTKGELDDRLNLQEKRLFLAKNKTKSSKKKLSKMNNGNHGKNVGYSSDVETEVFGKSKSVDFSKEMNRTCSFIRTDKIFPRSNSLSEQKSNSKLLGSPETNMPLEYNKKFVFSMNRKSYNITESPPRAVIIIHNPPSPLPPSPLRILKVISATSSPHSPSPRLSPSPLLSPLSPSPLLSPLSPSPLSSDIILQSAVGIRACENSNSELKKKQIGLNRATI